MTNSTHLTRRGLLVAAPLAGIIPALPAMAMTKADTNIGLGFAQWQRIKQALDSGVHDLDNQNKDYVAWCALHDHLLSLPCQSMADLAAKIMMDTHLDGFELSAELVGEIHQISGAYLGFNKR